jgi:hypothetical protein
LEVRSYARCVSSLYKAQQSLTSYIGTFTSLYKLLLNALPILIPAMNPPEVIEKVTRSTSVEIPLPVTSGSSKSEEVRKGKLRLTTHAQLLMIRKRTRRWHSALAGFVAGGLAIMWEKNSRRNVISQQMFVR